MMSPTTYGMTKKLIRYSHPQDAAAQKTDILLEDRTCLDGYKLVIGGDYPYGNCNEVDKTNLLEKCVYLTAAFSIAISS